MKFAKYLANQIMRGNLDAELVYKLYPQYAAKVKEILGVEDNIPTVEE